MQLYSCYACGNNRYKIALRNRDRDDNVICALCYLTIFYIPSNRKSFNKRQLEYYHKKEKRNHRLSYRGKPINVNYAIKVGVCNLCRAVWPFDTVQTQMHHDKYDDNNPLAHVLEVCNSCHSKITVLQERITSAILWLVREEIGYIPTRQKRKPIATMSRTRQIYLERRFG